LVTIIRVFLELANQIQSPLLEGCLYNKRFKREGREALLSRKELARLTGSDIVMCVIENSRPIIYYPQKFMGGSAGHKMSSTLS
jgi:hypothetical protein